MRLVWVSEFPSQASSIFPGKHRASCWTCLTVVQALDVVCEKLGCEAPEEVSDFRKRASQENIWFVSGGDSGSDLEYEHGEPFQTAQDHQLVIDTSPVDRPPINPADALLDETDGSAAAPRPRGRSFGQPRPLVPWPSQVSAVPICKELI